MTEETIFAEALEKKTPSDRTAYLDQACADDVVLRQRIDTLLKSHDVEDSFLGKPAIQCAAEELADQACSRDTQDDLPGDGGDEALEFLVPSDKPGVLGRLAHYDILEVVGKGGMGIVLRGFDEQLHRVVAIKVMAAQLATNATARKRFAREAQAQAAVSHDHIVTIHAVEAESSLPYLVMQYIAGMSLQERLDKSGALQLHEFLRIGMQTAAGLAAAHAQGLVHRDIKPANILLENGVERVKITDFGLARAATEASLTQSGVVAGTPQYMSPEQAEGKVIDQRTDLFSLGSVLYAMCTGRAPFRASGTMAVLKRVCEETPTPIRETNPDVPDWLVAIIDKLHAKDLAQRYQSAAEVAELLGRHLAYVQHPSVVPLLPSPSGRAAWGEGLSPAQPRRRRLAVAAAVFLCFLVGLGLTEATGVTNVRGTVIRIFTPDGTLIVEVDDPGVKVTVEGDGGLVITGAGLEEIRLRPGSYKVQADRDGKTVPLERELVTIAKGGREVVKVKLEARAAPAAAKADKGVFMVLGGKAIEVRKYDTLAEAVRGASDGDTIEVRGNGPFVTEPIKTNSALTIRAGLGFRPVIKLSPEGLQVRALLFDTKAPLVLEGLELQRVAQEPGEGWQVVVMATKALHVANCRFLIRNTAACISPNSPVCELRNCEFIGCREAGEDAVMTYNLPNRRLVIDNCLHATSAAGLFLTGGEPNALVQLTRNTFRTRFSLALGLGREKLLKFDEANQQVKFVHVDASSNVFDGASSVFLFVEAPPGTTISQVDAESFCKRRLGWKGERNLYALNGPLVNLNLAWRLLEPANPVRTLAGWRRFWGTTEADSIEGRVRYKGGDLRGKAEVTPELLTPDDFRLRSDSAGYRAGKDGKDLGADVDLVGPGPAYERWKKTPEYQQWLKDTKQVK